MLAHNLASHHPHHHPSHGPHHHGHHHPAAQQAPPTDFWPANFALHYPLMQHNPALLHPNYKLPNFHAILSQYMGLNNLGLFGYSQNMPDSRLSPDASPKQSPNLKDPEK